MKQFISGIFFFRNVVACLILLLLSGDFLYGRQIWVSLYNSRQVRSVVVSAYNGPLNVLADGSEQFTIAFGQAVYADLRDGKIWLSNDAGQIGAFEQLMVQGADSATVVRLRPMSPQAEARNYEELVSLTADDDRIHLINRIDECTIFVNIRTII